MKSAEAIRLRQDRRWERVRPSLHVLSARATVRDGRSPGRSSVTASPWRSRSMQQPSLTATGIGSMIFKGTQAFRPGLVKAEKRPPPVTSPCDWRREQCQRHCGHGRRFPGTAAAPIPPMDRGLDTRHPARPDPASAHSRRSGSWMVGNPNVGKRRRSLNRVMRAIPVVVVVRTTRANASWTPFLLRR
jgi:hypothetical protein